MAKVGLYQARARNKSLSLEGACRSRMNASLGGVNNTLAVYIFVADTCICRTT